MSENILLAQLESKFTKGEGTTREKKPWTKDQVAILIVMHMQDGSRKDIADATGHPEFSVTYKIGRVKALKAEKGVEGMLSYFKLTTNDLREVIEAFAGEQEEVVA